MIKIKHFLDTVENDDGKRLWIEPIGVAPEFIEWCSIDHVLSHLGPPKKLWEWYEEHPDGYEAFRGQYHDLLKAGPSRDALQQLARVAARGETFTLLHQCEDPLHNSATALYEFIVELEAYIKPE